MEFYNRFQVLSEESEMQSSQASIGSVNNGSTTPTGQTVTDTQPKTGAKDPSLPEGQNTEDDQRGGNHTQQGHHVGTGTAVNAQTSSETGSSMLRPRTITHVSHPFFATCRDNPWAAISQPIETVRDENTNTTTEVTDQDNVVRTEFRAWMNHLHSTLVYLDSRITFLADQQTEGFHSARTQLDNFTERFRHANWAMSHPFYGMEADGMRAPTAQGGWAMPRGRGRGWSRWI